MPAARDHFQTRVTSNPLILAIERSETFAASCACEIGAGRPPGVVFRKADIGIIVLADQQLYRQRAQGGDINGAAEEPLGIGYAGPPVERFIEQRHPARRRQRERGQALRVKIGETMGKLRAAGKTAQHESLARDGVALAYLVHHAQQNAIEANLLVAQQLVIFDIMRVNEAGGEQRAKQQDLIAVGEVCELIAIEGGVTVGPVHVNADPSNLIRHV